MEQAINILRQQFLVMYPLIVLLTAIVIFAVYVFYQTDRKFKLKFLLGPLLILCTSLSFTLVGSRLGFGFPAPLPERFEFFAYNVTLNDEGTEKVWLDVMLITKKNPNARLHRIPWSKRLEDALKKASEMKRAGQGGSVVMELEGGAKSKKGKGKDGDDFPKDAYVPKRVVPSDVIPKGPMPEMPPGMPPITTEPEKPQNQERIHNYSI